MADVTSSTCHDVHQVCRRLRMMLTGTGVHVPIVMVTAQVREEGGQQQQQQQGKRRQQCSWQLLLLGSSYSTHDCGMSFRCAVSCKGSGSCGIAAWLIQSAPVKDPDGGTWCRHWWHWWCSGMSAAALIFSFEPASFCISMLVRGVDNLAVFCILPYNLSLPLVAVTAWIHYGCAVMSFRWHLIASNDVNNVALFDHRRQDRLTTCHVLPVLITASVGRTRQWCSV